MRERERERVCVCVCVCVREKERERQRVCGCVRIFQVTCTDTDHLSILSGTVLGALLMESFFVVFDRENKQMGFAQTTCPPPYPGSSKSDQAIDGLRSV